MRFCTTVMLGGKTATGLAVPGGVMESLGAGRRPKVIVTIGSYSYRSTVMPMNGQFMVPLAAEHREAAGVVAGEDVEVDLVLDDAPREVDVPDDFAAAMAATPAARPFFDSLSYTHRKEWVRWIVEAKKPETRDARIAKAVDALLAGKRAR